MKGSNNRERGEDLEEETEDMGDEVTRGEDPVSDVDSELEDGISEEVMEEEEGNLVAKETSGKKSDGNVASAASTLIVEEEATKSLAGLGSKNPDDICAALDKLREDLRGDKRDLVAQLLFKASSDFSEFLRLWDPHQPSKVCVGAMMLVAHALLLALPSASAEAATQSVSSQECAVQARLDALARQIIQRQLSTTYSHLTSGQRNRVNAALSVLAAVAARGKGLARELAASFDFTLPALSRFAGPPRSAPAGDKAAPPPFRTIHALLKSGPRDPAKVSTRLLFFLFALAFLDAGDAATVRYVTQQRVLYGNILRGVAGDHESTVAHVLAALHARILTSGIVPAGLQGALLSDDAVDQLLLLATHYDGPPSAAPPGPSATSSQLAYDILHLITTDSAHGICPPPAPPLGGGGEGQGGSKGRLLRVLLRCKPLDTLPHRQLLLDAARRTPLAAQAYLAALPFSLEPRLSDRWLGAMSLVSQLIAVGSEAAAAAAAAAGQQGEPLVVAGLSKGALSRGLQHRRPLVQYATLCVLLEQLSAVRRLRLRSAHFSPPPPPPEQQQQQQGPDAAAAGGTRPLPTSMAPQDLRSFVLSLLDDNGGDTPAAAEEAQQQQGQRLGSMAAPPGGSGSSSSSFVEAVRASLPDPQVLLALKNATDKYGPMLALHRNAAGADAEHSLVEAGSKRQRESKHAEEPGRKKKKKKKERERDAELAVAAAAADGEEPEGEAEEEEEEGGIEEELAEEVECEEGGVKQALGVVLQARVLDALAAYQRALPEAMADANATGSAFKLLPSDAGAWVLPPLLVQRSLVSLLAASSACALPAHQLFAQPQAQAQAEAAAGPLSGAALAQVLRGRSLSVEVQDACGMLHLHFLPLAHLAVRAGAADVREQAVHVARLAMAASGAFDAFPPEIDVWLHHLLAVAQLDGAAAGGGGGGGGGGGLSGAVMAFVADALAAVARSLPRYLEQLRALLPPSALSGGGGGGGGGAQEEVQFGPLVVCVVDHVCRVAAAASSAAAVSSRTVSNRAAIACYCAAALSALLHSQVLLPRSHVTPTRALSSRTMSQASSRRTHACGRVVVAGVVVAVAVVAVQADPRPLAHVLRLAISASSSKLGGSSSSSRYLCESAPLWALLSQAEIILTGASSSSSSSSSVEDEPEQGSSVQAAAAEERMEQVLHATEQRPAADDVAAVKSAFARCLVCTPPALVMHALPQLIRTCHASLDGDFAVLSLLGEVYPHLLIPSLEGLLSHQEEKEAGAEAEAEAGEGSGSESEEVKACVAALPFHLSTALAVARCTGTGRKEAPAAAAEAIAVASAGRVERSSKALAVGCILQVLASCSSSSSQGPAVLLDLGFNVLHTLLGFAGPLLRTAEPIVNKLVGRAAVPSSKRSEEEDVGEVDLALACHLLSQPVLQGLFLAAAGAGGGGGGGAGSRTDGGHAGAAGGTGPTGKSGRGVLNAHILNLVERLMLFCARSQVEQQQLAGRVQAACQPFIAKAVAQLLADARGAAASGAGAGAAEAEAEDILSGALPFAGMPALWRLARTILAAAAPEGRGRGDAMHILPVASALFWKVSLAGAAAAGGGSCWGKEEVGEPEEWQVLYETLVSAALLLLQEEREEEAAEEPPSRGAPVELGILLALHSYTGEGGGSPCFQRLPDLVALTPVRLLQKYAAARQPSDTQGQILALCARYSPQHLHAIARTLQKKSKKNKKNKKKEQPTAEEDAGKKLASLLPAVCECLAHMPPGSQAAEDIAEGFRGVVVGCLLSLSGSGGSGDGGSSSSATCTQGGTVRTWLAALRACHARVSWKGCERRALLRRLVPKRGWLPSHGQADGPAADPVQVIALSSAAMCLVLPGADLRDDADGDTVDEDHDHDRDHDSPPAHVDDDDVVDDVNDDLLRLVGALMSTLAAIYKGGSPAAEEERRRWGEVEEVAAQHLTAATKLLRLDVAAGQGTQYVAAVRSFSGSVLRHRLGRGEQQQQQQQLALHCLHHLLAAAAAAPTHSQQQQQQSKWREEGGHLGVHVLRALLSHPAGFRPLLLLGLQEEGGSSRRRRNTALGLGLGLGLGLRRSKVEAPDGSLLSVIAAVDAPSSSPSSSASSHNSSQVAPRRRAGAQSEEEGRSTWLCNALRLPPPPPAAAAAAAAASGGGAGHAGVAVLQTLLRLIHGAPLALAEPALESSLFALLLGAYDASMSPEDRTILELLHAIERHAGAGFRGLEAQGYAWGPEAASTTAAAAGSEGARTIMAEVDPVRCALTAAYFPCHRDLLAPSSVVGSVAAAAAAAAAGGGNDDVTAEEQQDARERAVQQLMYDPAFILPAAKHVVTSGTMTSLHFARCGLLAIVMSSLAAQAEAVRKLGYQTLAAYSSRLDEGPGFREKAQLQQVVRYVRNAITLEWQQLPRVSTLFVAEAVCTAVHAGSALYTAINRALLTRPALDLQDITMFHAMFHSGSQSSRAERMWMLRLLAAGLVSDSDYSVLYRRRFVVEQLMACYSSSLADTPLRLLILQVIGRAARVQAAAEDLVLRAGLLLWLSHTAARALAAFEDAASLASLQAIERLLKWPAVMERGSVLHCALLLHRAMASHAQTGVQARLSVLRILNAVMSLPFSKAFLSVSDMMSLIRWADVKGSPDASASGENMAQALAMRAILSNVPSHISPADSELLVDVVYWMVSELLRMPALVSVQLVEKTHTLGQGSEAAAKKGLNGLHERHAIGSAHLAEQLMRWLADVLDSLVACEPTSKGITQLSTSSKEVMARAVLLVYGHVEGRHRSKIAAYKDLVLSLLAV